MGWVTTGPAGRKLFPSLDAALNVEGEIVNSNWMSSLVRISVESEGYYVKCYASRGRWLRRLLGRSRLRAEWENLQRFEALGVPTAELIAYGETVGTREYRGAMITKELVGTRDLVQLSQHACMKDRHWRHQLIMKLARMVRKLHDARFVHNDLKWRNILADDSVDPGVYIIDCPQGRQMSGLLLRRGCIKDLACLDKVAKKVLSPAERMRFYKAYRGCQRLSDADKHQIRKVLGFFAGRE
jgi:tRNA A-37 threonylcarbamoyl transferase component Bud32